MWTAVQQTDNLLLGYFETSTDVGIYDGAFLLARLLLIVLAAFGFLFMPVFSELESADEIDRMQDVYSSVVEWSMLLVLPTYIAVMTVPSEILISIFKQSYAPGAIPLMIISTGFFIHVLSGSCGDALVAIGRTKVVLAGNASAGILNILLNVFLIPKFGISGAAAASAVSYALFNLFFLFWLHRETGIVPFSMSFLRPVSISIVLVSTIWIIGRWLSRLSIVSIVMILITTYLIHAVVIARTKPITPGDKQLLSKLESKLGIDFSRIF
jgi:O-antigen/teichoic acid export membrane protein